jgi:arsenate reductase
MLEDGIDISAHTSNHVDEYLQIPFDLVLTVCDHASERCPIFPSTAKRIHHNFSDPAKATGSEEEIREAFRRVREEIKLFCKDLVI